LPSPNGVDGQRRNFRQSVEITRRVFWTEN